MLSQSKEPFSPTLGSLGGALLFPIKWYLESGCCQNLLGSQGRVGWGGMPRKGSSGAGECWGIWTGTLPASVVLTHTICLSESCLSLSCKS